MFFLILLHFFKSGFFRFRQGSNLRPFDFTGLLHRTVKCYYLLSYESNGVRSSLWAFKNKVWLDCCDEDSYFLEKYDKTI